MLWGDKWGAAAHHLPVFHQGKVDLIGVSAAAPALPDQSGRGQFFHRLNDFVIAHLHFAGQRTACVDDEYLTIIIDPAIEPGELKAVEQKGVCYFSFQGEPHVLGIGKQPSGHL